MASNLIYPIGRSLAIPFVILRQSSFCIINIIELTCSYTTLRIEIHSLLSIGIIHVVICHRSEALLNINIDIQLALSTLLGGNDNHTISCTSTINSSCGSILQYSNSLNILRIHRCHWIQVVTLARVCTFRIRVHWHTIDYIQWLST